MITILKAGIFETSDDENSVVEMSLQYQNVIIPNDDDLDLTNWWVILDQGQEALYVGTPETFALYVSEETGTQD